MLWKNSKERWKDCSFCTYYQRPNLMAGEFREIMPNEDRHAIESLTMRKVKFHLQNRIETTGTADRYFTSMVEEVLVDFSDKDVSPLKSPDESLTTEGKYLLQHNPINLGSRRPNRYREKKLNLNKPEIPWFNAYPLKIETNKTFPLFLAICRGDESLNMVLGKILKQAQKIVEVYSEDEIVKRNVILLTNK